MGENPAEIEHDIELRRERLSRNIEVPRDVGGAGRGRSEPEDAKEEDSRGPAAKDRAQGAHDWALKIRYSASRCEAFGRLSPRCGGATAQAVPP